MLEEAFGRLELLGRGHENVASEYPRLREISAFHHFLRLILLRHLYLERYLAHPTQRYQMPGFQAIPKASTSNEGGATKSRLLKYTGHNRLRYRLVLSLLSRRPVRIDNIRSDDDEPGLRGAFSPTHLAARANVFFFAAEYEITFLRLMERISNGTVVEISYTGKGCCLAQR